MSNSESTVLSLRVVAAAALNPLIKQFTLAAADGSALPGWTPGAHIRVQVRLPDGNADWRHYSLIDLAQDASAHAPTHYTIAVRREAEGQGGSRFMHEQLQPGDTIAVETPKNDFPLHSGADATEGSVLLAGGIGVTPLASMAAQLRRDGRPVRMHYAGRSRTLMAFLPELQALLADALRVHADDEAGSGFDVNALLDGCGAGERLYVCGPKAMLDAVLAATQARGWPPERVHFELFTTPVVEEGDHAFEVELALSGQTFTVAADQTILDAMIEHGCDPLFDCKRGECGVCAVPVMAGEIDHRDYVLTQREKDAGNVIQVCISRCKGARLVLDI